MITQYEVKGSKGAVKHGARRPIANRPVPVKGISKN